MTQPCAPVYSAGDSKLREGDVMSDLSEQIKNSVMVYLKNTVGYWESSNKDEFMKGAAMAFDYGAKMFDLEIEKLRQLAKSEELAKEKAEGDIQIISDILARHSRCAS
jgi:hypothetical protein